MGGFGVQPFGTSPFGGNPSVPTGGGGQTASLVLTDPFRSGGYSLWYSLDARRGTTLVASDLRPTGGTITDTTKAGVRRTLNLELAPEVGLFDELSPTGTTLTATAHMRIGGQTTDTPIGVFDIDTESLTEGGGKLSLTAPDKWQRVVRAKFLRPQASTRGMAVTAQIADLVRGALGSGEGVTITSSSSATMGPQVWEKDRDKAIIDLATGIGAWVYFDRNGGATVADFPAIGSSADWLVDASATGVLLELDRQRSRTNTFNVVVVTSSASSDAKFDPQVAWDNNPSSPTYAGPDPLNHPELAGPFGVSVLPYDTPLDMGAPGALQTAATILAKTVALNAQVSVSMAPNVSVDAGQVLDILGPRERYDLPRPYERHIADTVTHQLVFDASSGGLHIDGRATRSDSYT